MNFTRFALPAARSRKNQQECRLEDIPPAFVSLGMDFTSSVAMTRLLRTWLPPVSTCLLLQGAIAGGSIMMNRWLAPPTPCCDSLQAR